jgi:hypothetical protein
MMVLARRAHVTSQLRAMAAPMDMTNSMTGAFLSTVARNWYIQENDQRVIILPIIN